LDLNGFNETIGSLIVGGNANVTLGSGSLTLGGNGRGPESGGCRIAW
jgi:hypothetical protein